MPSGQPLPARPPPTICPSQLPRTTLFPPSPLPVASLPTPDVQLRSVSLCPPNPQLKDPLQELLGAVRPCGAVSGHGGGCPGAASNAPLCQVRSLRAADMPKELHEWCLNLCRCVGRGCAKPWVVAPPVQVDHGGVEGAWCVFIHAQQQRHYTVVFGTQFGVVCQSGPLAKSRGGFGRPCRLVPPIFRKGLHTLNLLAVACIPTRRSGIGELEEGPSRIVGARTSGHRS